MELELTAVEARVLGSLIEKEIATPEYYPMTLNALTNACNQKSNREPVMQLEPGEVEEALDTLRYDKQVVWRETSTGSRVPKYRQDIRKRIGLTDGELALLCMLLLRGPQTPGELRSRSTRLHEFGSLEDVEEALKQMAGREEPLVVRLPREPGRREARYAHLLSGELDVEALAAEAQAQAPVSSSREDRLAALEAAVAELREQVDRLSRLVGPLGEPEDEDRVEPEG